jgi:hypothetical protein
MLIDLVYSLKKIINELDNYTDISNIYESIDIDPLVASKENLMQFMENIVESNDYKIEMFETYDIPLEDSIEDEELLAEIRKEIESSDSISLLG